MIVYIISVRVQHKGNMPRNGELPRKPQSHRVYTPRFDQYYGNHGRLTSYGNLPSESVTAMTRDNGYYGYSQNVSHVHAGQYLGGAHRRWQDWPHGHQTSQYYSHEKQVRETEEKVW